MSLEKDNIGGPDQPLESLEEEELRHCPHQGKDILFVVHYLNPG